MNAKLPFLAKYRVRRQKDSPLIGHYSEQESLHIKLVNEERIPLILTDEILPETKTITEAGGERED